MLTTTITINSSKSSLSTLILLTPHSRVYYQLDGSQQFIQSGNSFPLDTWINVEIIQRQVLDKVRIVE